MEENTDWLGMLPSVLFACRTTKNMSTGITPFRMVFNTDPVLPFEFKDKVDNDLCSDSDISSDLDVGDTDDLFARVQSLESQRSQMFGKAKTNINKAQKHYAKNYNRRHQGEPFPIGCKVLKKNMRDHSRKQKLRKLYSGVYTVTGRSKDGTGYYLKDKYSHKLVRAVPAVQLRWYNERDPGAANNSDVGSELSDCESSENTQKPTATPKSYHSMSENSDSDSEIEIKGRGFSQNSGRPTKSEISENSENESNTEENDIHFDGTNGSTDSLFSENLESESESKDAQNLSTDSISCSRAKVFKPSKNKEYSSVKSQMVFISSMETNLLSDDNSTIDLEIPWDPELNVNDIPIDILHEDGMGMGMSLLKGPDPIYFYPLEEPHRIEAARKLHLRIKYPAEIKFSGIGKLLVGPPVDMLNAKGNGACYYNSISILLTGTDLYHYLVRHVVCRFIEDHDNAQKLEPYLGKQNGAEYLLRTRQKNISTWATELEIYATAMLTGFPVVVYTESGQWLKYGEFGLNMSAKKQAFFLNNTSGNHFDPVTHV